MSLAMLGLILLLTVLDLILGNSGRELLDIFLCGLALAVAAMSEFYTAFGYIIISCGIFSAVKRYKDINSGAMIKNASGLSAMKYQYMAADGTIHYRLDISWERESPGTYQIFTSNDNVNWDMLVSIDGTQYTGDVPEDTAYVKVVTVNSIMRSPGVSMTITNMISMIAGLEIADLTATVSGTSVKLTWREITNTNLQYYRILVDDSAEYRVLNATFELSGLTAGRHVIDVTAVNKAGISGIAATTTITIP
jgi:hypothetical protein